MKNSEKFKTAKKRARAFSKWCNLMNGKNCLMIKSCNHCAFTWLDLEAPPEKEKPLPCPFCGGEVEFAQLVGGDSVRCKCGYCAPFFDSESEAIAAHNKVARAVMKEKETVNQEEVKA